MQSSYLVRLLLIDMDVYTLYIQNLCVQCSMYCQYPINLTIAMITQYTDRKLAAPAPLYEHPKIEHLPAPHPTYILPSIFRFLSIWGQHKHLHPDPSVALCILQYSSNATLASWPYLIDAATTKCYITATLIQHATRSHFQSTMDKLTMFSWSNFLM